MPDEVHARRCVPVWLALLALALPIGCASTSDSHVKKLASSGVAYGTALDSLLATTEATAVDASSSRLVSETAGEKDAAIRTQFLDSQDKIVKPQIEVLEKLRQQARLLAKYFQALAELAEDSSDKEVGDSLVGSARALQKLGTELGASKLLGQDEQDALHQAAGIVVHGVRQHAIAVELEARGNLIDLQLRINEALVRALAEKLKADLATLSVQGYARDVKEPFVSDRVTNTKSWMALRKQYLLADRNVDALEKVAAAATQLRAAWRACLEGRFDDDAIQDVLKDVDSALSLTESIEAARK